MWSILPSLPAYSGLVLSLWSSAYVATRTGYARNTRLVRLALISIGAWWLGVFLSEQPGSSDDARLWTLIVLPFAVLAPSLWCLWLAHGLPRTSHLAHHWRFVFLLPAALVALPTLPTTLAGVLPGLRLPGFAQRLTAGPLAAVAVLVISGMLAGATGMLARTSRVVTTARARRALGWMLAGTLLAGLSLALWGWGSALLDALAQLLLIAGVLALAYGSVTFVLHEGRRSFALDFLTSGVTALGIGGLYLILVDFILSRGLPNPLPYLLVVLMALTTMLIFSGEGLRMMLDRLRIDRARRLDKELLQLLVRQLSAPHVAPEEMLEELLTDFSQAIRAERLALVTLEQNETRLLASRGGAPAVLPPPDALRFRRTRACSVAGFTHSVPLLEDGDVRGALLVGAWRDPNAVAHLYRELEYLGSLLAVLVRHLYETRHTPVDRVITETQIDTDQHMISWRLQRFPRAKVYVRILGALHLEYNGAPLEIPRTGIGRIQLTHIIAYLVITRGTYSSIDTLKELTPPRRQSEPRPGKQVRPELQPRLKKVFAETWRLPEGMVSWDGRRVRFEDSPVWYTDIDLIEAYIVAAGAELETGNRQHALEHFAAAYQLCSGEVLPETNFLPDAEQQRRALADQWAATHKHLLQSYAELLLHERDRESRQLSLKLATELASTYADDEAALQGAARLAADAGEPALARTWRRQAQTLAAEGLEFPEERTDA